MVITIPKPLRDKLGDQAVDSLVEVLNQVSNNVRDEILEALDEKLEARLAVTSAELRQFFLEELNKLRREMDQRYADLERQIKDSHTHLQSQIDLQGAKMDKLFEQERSERKAEQATLKAELVRWMFLFWVGQVAVLGGLLYAMMRLMAQ